MVYGNRLPSRIGSMAIGTIGRKTTGLVIGILSVIIVILMTGNTIGRSIGKITRSMALVTILDIMPKGEWKKFMVACRGRAPSRIGSMAIGTIGRKITISVIRILRIVIIILMAANTIWVGIREITRSMALTTILYVMA